MRRASVAAVSVAAMVLMTACGYAPVNASPGGGRLHVKLVRSVVADAVAADEVAQGVREALALHGALESGEGYPRVEIEVVRADESSEGLTVGPTGSIAPLARATALAVVARGWIVEAAGGEPQRDSGDMRAEASIAVDESGSTPDPRASTFHSADAVRSAARRLGRSIGQRVLGLPAASDQAPERL